MSAKGPGPARVTRFGSVVSDREGVTRLGPWSPMVSDHEHVWKKPRSESIFRLCLNAFSCFRL